MDHRRAGTWRHHLALAVVDRWGERVRVLARRSLKKKTKRRRRVLAAAASGRSGQIKGEEDLRAALAAGVASNAGGLTMHAEARAGGCWVPAAHWTVHPALTVRACMHACRGDWSGRTAPPS